MKKSFGQIDYIPEAIGLVAGIGDGMIGLNTTTPHLRTYYRATLAALGVIGDRAAHWSPDVSIGLMVCAATGAASAIPVAIHDKTSSGEGGLFPYAAASVAPHADPAVAQRRGGGLLGTGMGLPAVARHAEENNPGFMGTGLDRGLPAVARHEGNNPGFMGTGMDLGMPAVAHPAVIPGTTRQRQTPAG